MSVSSPSSAPHTVVTAPHLSELADQTRAFADQTFEAVAQEYLAFRREYYHEAEPSLATLPQAHAEIRKSEVALLAESMLRLAPQAVKSIPLVGSFVTHLRQVADMHSIAEDERAALHNLAMGFLHGVRGGIQPWYVEWLLASAHNLSQISDLDYYLEFPFDGLLYRDPAALATFDAAVRQGDTAAIRREIERMAAKLIEALRDPVGVQPLLAFTGPDGERRHVVFNLQTTAALALMAYLIATEVRLLSNPRQDVAFHSALASLPPQLKAQTITE